MNIQTFDSPRPNMIIDDFFTEEELSNVMYEIRKLAPKLTVGTLNHGGKEVVNKQLKNNKTLVLDDIYGADRTQSPILSKYDKVLWSKEGEIRKAMLTSKYPIFECLKFIKVDNTQLSVYNNGEFFDFHTDNQDKVAFCTINITLCHEPKQFTGGDMVFRWNDETKTIPFKNNTCYVFPMMMPHKITPLSNNDGDFMHCRYSLNCFGRVLI